jgi:hypothetical protein
MTNCELCDNEKYAQQHVCDTCYSRKEHPAYYSKIKKIMERNDWEALHA